MNYIQITQTEIGTDEVNAVNARDIHEHLKVKTRFNDWISRIIERYAFVEDSDYSKLSNGKKVDYIVTLDMAKELCMVDDNAKGKEYRKYFIKIEKETSKKSLMTPNQITEALALTAKSLTLQDERMDSHNDRISELEQNRRLETWQEKALIDAHHKKVYQLADQYKEDSRDKKLISSLHRKVWQLFKRHFSLPRYNELSVGKFDDGITYINNLDISDMV